MTIEQAKAAVELLDHRRKIKLIQQTIRVDKALVVSMPNRSIVVPEDALPYIEKALERAMNEIETKISKL